MVGVILNECCKHCLHLCCKKTASLNAGSLFLDTVMDSIVVHLINFCSVAFCRHFVAYCFVFGVKCFSILCVIM